MKQITILIDEEGHSSVDLTGFTDGTCASVMKDFQGDDQLVKEYKKPECFRQGREEIEEHQRQRR